MKLLLYCCKAKPYLRKLDNYFLDKHNDNYYWEKGQTAPYSLNGKIVAECDYEVEEIKYDWYPQNIVPKGDPYYTYYKTSKIEPKEFYKKSCLNWEQLNSYLNDYDSQKFDGGYAIHIKNLHIFDKPKELGNYYSQGQVDWIEETELYRLKNGITKAPQNMCYAYKYSYSKGKLEKYVLISIRSEWLCKILNGEKKVEIRKKVLKEMINNG